MLIFDTGHDKVVQLLIESNAEIDGKDNLEYTALLWAAFRGYLDNFDTKIQS